MTRPMPGPHDSPLHEGKEWFYACTACSGLWSESDEWAAEEKRLTDAEAAAEYWRAEADEMVHSYTWYDSEFRDEEADDAYAHSQALPCAVKV